MAIGKRNFVSFFLHQKAWGAENRKILCPETSLARFEAVRLLIILNQNKILIRVNTKNVNLTLAFTSVLSSFILHALRSCSQMLLIVFILFM